MSRGSSSFRSGGFYVPIVLSCSLFKSAVPSGPITLPGCVAICCRLLSSPAPLWCVKEIWFAVAVLTSHDRCIRPPAVPRWRNVPSGRSVSARPRRPAAISSLVPIVLSCSLFKSSVPSGPTCLSGCVAVCRRSFSHSAPVWCVKEI